MSISNDKNIFEIKDLKKWFPVRRSFKEVVNKQQRYVKAVDGVTFNIRKGEIFGLVGESGCGKTTTGKLIMKLLDHTHGQMMFNDEDVTFLDHSRLADYRTKVQMIFQDPYASMNPRFRIRDVLEEPLVLHKIAETREE